MSYISKIDLSTAPQEVRAAVDNHLAQGYQLTNEKLTLLHSRSLRAVCWASGGHLTFVAKAILDFIIVLIMASSMGNPYACRFDLL